jgi:catechol 2,3-dioxygenase-like lactoylglutathione lyase family enzyme
MIIAPAGSPVAFMVVSCGQLEESLEFYVGRIGLEAGAVVDWDRDELERLWAPAPAPCARACLLGMPGVEVGRILLIEFAAAARVRVALESSARQFGLANLNFYSADLRAAAADLGAAGYRFWSEPTQHGLTAAVGTPLEVLFDGPDGVAINLVELVTRDPATRIGQMRGYVESLGYTRTGYTPVVTTSHVVRSIRRAREFCERVLGMGALIDEEMGLDRSNAFLRLPRDARTHITFMQGNHMFGKIALAEPLNYECLDLVPRAVAPNLGLLAQGFEVADVEAARRATAALWPQCVGGELLLELPGRDAQRGFVARNPGSGAAHWILQAEPPQAEPPQASR